MSEKLGNKLIVGCPVKNDLESLTAMIESLTDSTEAFLKIVFIIGKDTNKETLDWLENPLRPKYIEVINAQTETPLEAYNLLFQIAKEERTDLLVTQTDVLFTKLYKRDWLQIMKDLAQDERVGAIIPINGGGIAGPDYIDKFEWLGGWCTYYPFKTLEKIGGYDDNFPNGYGVDIDHTYRISLEQLSIYKVNYWVDHHMMNEREHDNDIKTEEMKKESSLFFKKKWDKQK